MKRNNNLKIKDDITKFCIRIASCADQMGKDTTTAKSFYYRLSNEIPVKIKEMIDSIFVTLLNYLDQDAEKFIDKWESKHKNSFYDSEIKNKISLPVYDTDFSQIYNPMGGEIGKYFSLLSILVGIYFLFFGKFTFQSGVGIFLIINAVYVFMKRENILKAYEKCKVLITFNKILKNEEERLKRDCEKIILDYYMKFEKIKKIRASETDDGK